MKVKSKINSKQYSELVPAIAAYRGYIKQYAGIASGKDYATIYTEPRVYGARSKFYMSKFSDKAVKKITDYINEHPVCYVYAGKRKFEEYTVSLQKVNVYGRSSRKPDYQLVFSAK